MNTVKQNKKMLYKVALQSIRNVVVLNQKEEAKKSKGE